jgi:hypothetical protein
MLFIILKFSAIKECIKWINAPDTSVNYNAAYEKITEGTGMWLMQDPRFTDWKANGGLLWLQGKGDMIFLITLYIILKNFDLFIAGSGKTFLL